jgi:hypothetical protein
MNADRSALYPDQACLCRLSGSLSRDPLADGWIAIHRRNVSRFAISGKMPPWLRSYYPEGPLSLCCALITPAECGLSTRAATARVPDEIGLTPDRRAGLISPTHRILTVSRIEVYSTLVQCDRFLAKPTEK